MVKEKRGKKSFGILSTLSLEVTRVKKKWIIKEQPTIIISGETAVYRKFALSSRKGEKGFAIMSNERMRKPFDICKLTTGRSISKSYTFFSSSFLFFPSFFICGCELFDGPLLSKLHTAGKLFKYFLKKKKKKKKIFFLGKKPI